MDVTTGKLIVALAEISARVQMGQATETDAYHCQALTRRIAAVTGKAMGVVWNDAYFAAKKVTRQTRR